LHTDEHMKGKGTLAIGVLLILIFSLLQ